MLSFIYTLAGLCVLPANYGLTTTGNLAQSAITLAAKSASEPAHKVVSGVDGDRFGTCITVKGDSPRVNVSLVNPHLVQLVLIYNNIGAGECPVLGDGIRGIEVYVGDQLCYTDTTPVGQDLREVIVAVCERPVNGSEVSLYLPDNGEFQTFSLCEVEVYDTSCNCLTGCAAEHTTCFGGCVSNTSCRRENVALGRPVNMSSTAPGSGSAQGAVDGDTTSTRDKDNSTSSCVTSASGDFNASLEVLLDRDYTISILKISRQRGYPRKMADTEITVDGQPCYKFPSSTDRQSLDALPEDVHVVCSKPLLGRRVRLSKDGSSPTDSDMYYPLAVCDVQVLVCQDGYYGPDCDLPCAAKCMGGANCDIINGKCPRGCAEHYYGADCTDACGKCANGAICDPINGSCPTTCEEGWELPLCLTCDEHHYGPNCSQCGHCEGGGCDSMSGYCPSECERGWHGQRCDTKGIYLRCWELGLTLGFLVAAAILITIGICCYRRRRRKQSGK